MNNHPGHWGFWCRDRAKLLGMYFPDVVKGTGIAPSRFTNWCGVFDPPPPDVRQAPGANSGGEELARNFDANLARNLKTTVKILFEDFRTTPAADAPIVNG